jgi:RNA polymerase-binding protein DksA
MAASPEAPAKRLKKTPLTKRQLESFRKRLLEKREEVFSDVSDMEVSALGGEGLASSSMPQHMADQGSDEYDQSLSLGIAESQRKLIREIDEALERIEDGTYGICQMLGTPIPRDRLEAMPWTKYSLEGARLASRQAYES